MNVVYYIGNKKVETVAWNVTPATARRVIASKERLYQYQMGRFKIEPS
jgi:hypothetical protein